MDIFEGAFHNPRTSFNGHCLNDTHKRALEAICSNSEETIRVLQQELTVMPTDQQQQLLRDLEEMFEPHFAKHLMLNLSNDWIIKYYALVLHRALHISMDKIDKVAEIVDKVPDFIKHEVYESVLQFFPDPEAIRNDPYHPNSWIERYCHLTMSMYSCLDKCSNWCMGIYTVKYQDE